MARCEGQVVEILFDADQWLTPADWAEPALEVPHPISGSLDISLPFVRRCSTSSSISCASPIQLSPTHPPPPATRAGDAASKTFFRPTASSLPRSPGLYVASLSPSCVPGAKNVVQQVQDPAVKQIKMRELKLVKKLASKMNTQTLKKTIVKTEQHTQ